jgi:ABC-type phosphate transport system substrate-binding protein
LSAAVLRLLLAIAVMAGLLAPGSAEAEELLIIANPSVDAPAPLTMSQIAAIYLLRTTAWPDGSRIIPVNREAASETRSKFTWSVLRQDNAALATYWNEMHFMGKLPPVVQESDQAMLAFVRKVPGSIGYISASTPAIGVKVLAHVP